MGTTLSTWRSDVGLGPGVWSLLHPKQPESCSAVPCPAALLQVAIHPGNALCNPNSSFCSDRPGWGSPHEELGSPRTPTATSRPLLCGHLQKAHIPWTDDMWRCQSHWLKPHRQLTPQNTSHRMASLATDRPYCCEGPGGCWWEEGTRVPTPEDYSKNEVPGSSWQRKKFQSLRPGLSPGLPLLLCHRRPAQSRLAQC